MNDIYAPSQELILARMPHKIARDLFKQAHMPTRQQWSEYHSHQAFPWEQTLEGPYTATDISDFVREHLMPGFKYLQRVDDQSNPRE